MFINVSNHSSALWDELQLKEAKKYGDIVDIPFPAVSPNGDEDYISKLANEYVELIMNTPGKLEAVMIQGEYNLTYELAKRLIQRGIRVMAACTERKVKEVKADDGKTAKESVFQFVKFREYGKQ